MGHIIMHPSIHLHIGVRTACGGRAPGEKQICASSGALFPPADFQQLLAPLLFSGPAPQIMETHQPLFQDRARRKNERERERADDERQGAEVHCGTSDMGFKNLYLFNCRSLWHKKEVYFTHFSVLDRADKRVCCLRSNEKNPCMRSLARSSRPPTAHTRAPGEKLILARGEWNGASSRGSLFKYSHIALVCERMWQINLKKNAILWNLS